MSTPSTTTVAHRISVQPSAREFWAQANETILNAAIAQGVPLPYGCKDGACGSCKCQKLSGEVEHDSYSPSALSQEEVASGFILSCRARAVSDVVLLSRQVASVDAHPVRKMPVRVQALERLAPDVMRVQLQLPATQRLAYYAGQYIEFVLPDGVRRAYSMACAPHEAASSQTMELHIRHMPGGRFTDHVFGAMKEREILRIEGPFGSFFLREDSTKPLIFIVSGTGFAPARAMLEHMREHGISRDVHLYWGARKRADLYMHDWMQQQCARMSSLRYTPVLSQPEPQDAWTGRTGLVHQAVLDDWADLSGHEVYACGAPAMVAAAHSSFTQQRGLAEEAFFADAFTSALDKLPG